MPNNPFDTLGLTPRFDLDPEELHRRFIAGSAANHPDRFLEPLDQADAADRSARINQAYRVLRDPQSRAEALLLVLGGPTAQADKSLPADLLDTMMERREELEAATARNDKAALVRLHQWAADQHAAHLGRIATLLAQAAAASTATPGSTAPLLREARRELNALAFFRRMLDETPETA